MTHPVVCIDTLASDYYVGSHQGMLRSGRFGMTLWSIFLGYRSYMVENHFSMALLSVGMLIWASINYCVLLRRASGDTIADLAYLVFCGFLITHPIINELWEYQAANIALCGGYLLTSFAIMAVYDQLSAQKIHIPKTLAAVLCMTMVCTSAEAVTVVYVFSVCAILWLQQIRKPDWKKHFIHGICYCIPIIAAIVCRMLGTKLILAVLQRPPVALGATEIAWQQSGSMLGGLKALVSDILTYHVLPGLYYYPLGITMVCALGLGVYGVILLCRKKVFAGLLMLGMVASMELLSVIQGVAAPYRTCQVFAMLCAFSLMLLVNWVRWKKLLAIALCFVCIRQGVYLSYLQELNYIRYEQEMTVVDAVGYELQRDYDPEKEVFFGGNYVLGSYIQDQITAENSPGAKAYTAVRTWLDPKYPSYAKRREVPESNVNSVLSWSTTVFGSQDYMRELFRYRGFDLRVSQEYLAIRDDLEKYIIDNQIPAYPQKGYITELDDIIIVNFGLPPETLEKYAE